MIKSIERVITQIILKHYDSLTDVEVQDLFGDYDERFQGQTYFANFTTNKCLSSKEMMQIDSEVKSLFKMIGVENTNPFSFKPPEIKSYFDCGDGEGFNFTGDYGYQH